ncbi:MAG: phosphate ABC transporter substrate-binding protein PstS [Pseudomonadota bacterium]
MRALPCPTRRGSRTAWSAALALSFAVLLTACVQTPEPEEDPAAPEVPVLRLRGAGASMPAPVYTRWSRQYYDLTQVRIEYRATGSLPGIEAIRAGRVDFAATDIPLDNTELERDGLLQFPIVVGGVVPVVHLPGIEAGDLTLSTGLLANIYLGRVTTWDDPAIAALNPDLDLPHTEIIPIHRDDASGTTWSLTHSLASSSQAWADTIGSGRTVVWPVGIGAKDNQQVLDFVRQFKHTLAYVELAQSERKGLAWASIYFHDDEILPTLDSLAAAAHGEYGVLDDALRLRARGAASEGGWPFIAASYVLMRRNQTDPERARALLDFFDWAYSDGRPVARNLSYVTVSAGDVEIVRAAWAAQIRASGLPVWAPPPPPEPPPSQEETTP